MNKIDIKKLVRSSIRYDHNKTETLFENKVITNENNKIYSHFTNEEKKKLFSIIMPPPNITGELHLGHAWNVYLQDFLLRFYFLFGKKTYNFFGIDHAGIAGQLKILKEASFEKKIANFSFAYVWKEKVKKKFLKQWTKLALFENIKNKKIFFSLDEDAALFAKKAFIKLYEEDLIYYGERMINWDPYLQTALADIEVNYKKIQTSLFFIKYPLSSSFNKEEKDKFSYLTVATTRPETIFADIALVVNPADSRYSKLIGKQVINPLTKKLIPIIQDSAVDINFGSGVLKCTPSHDFVDFEIAKKNNLRNFFSCFLKNGKMKPSTGVFAGLDRLECRKKVIIFFKENNFLLKTESYQTNVAYSRRSGKIIEPLLSKQWFLKMKPFKKEIFSLQKTKNKIKFFPEKFEKKMLTWLNNAEDWCLSRQIWWGIRLPVWFHKANKNKFIVSLAIDEKLKKEYSQSYDVLDTWFTSSLWPLIVTEYNLDTYQKFNPTSVLITAYDIINFWVLRMIMLTFHLTSTLPFKKVIFHGLIRDISGKKMSKSLGNGIDPLILINKYGSDVLRSFFLSEVQLGNDLILEESKLLAIWKFFNKIFNSLKFVLKMNYNLENLKKFSSKIKYFLNFAFLTDFQKILIKIKTLFKINDFKNIFLYLKNFYWDNFCSEYIEYIKKILPKCKDKIKKEIFLVIHLFWKHFFLILTPFAPFLSSLCQETIFQENYFFDKKKNKSPFLIKNIIFEKENILLFRLEKEIFCSLFKILNLWRKNYTLSKKIFLWIYLKQKIKHFQKTLKSFFKHLEKIFNIKLSFSFNYTVSLKKKEMFSEKTFFSTFASFGIKFVFSHENKILFLKQIDKEISDKKKNIIFYENYLNNKNFKKFAPKIKVEAFKNKLKILKEENKVLIKKRKEIISL